MHFTVEEFHTMVQELLYTEPSRFDTLCEIATRTLMPMIRSWCRRDKVVRGRGFEEDIMQNVLVKLVQNVVINFLQNDRAEGPYNDNPEGFERWIIVVGHNVQRDFANEIRRDEFITEDDEDVLDTLPVCDEDWVTVQEQRETLSRAFRMVIDSDLSVYKVLTWWAHILFIAEKSMEHHVANRTIVMMLENKTLQQMYDYVLAVSKKVPWMTITPEQHRHVMAALQKPFDEEHTYGETPYHRFYMKKGGNASVSDWVNRINGWVRNRLDDEKPDEESDEKPAPENKGKKGRDEDESSDIG